MVCCLCSSMMARKQLMPGMMLICLPLHSSTMLLERSMTQQTAVNEEEEEEEE